MKQSGSSAGTERRKAKVRSSPKGRITEPRALEEIRALLGNSPRRRDLLIEFLHLIQDKFGHLAARHLVALAAELRLSTAEVYEVATFYHHFDVVKENDAAPPALTVRVCESLSCELAGSHALLAKLRATLGDQVRVIPAPCVGRCETAPVAVVGRNPVCGASAEAVTAAVRSSATECPETKYIDFAAYRRKVAARDMSALQPADDRAAQPGKRNLAPAGDHVIGQPRDALFRDLVAHLRSADHQRHPGRYRLEHCGNARDLLDIPDSHAQSDDARAVLQQRLDNVGGPRPKHELHDARLRL